MPQDSCSGVESVSLAATAAQNEEGGHPCFPAGHWVPDALGWRSARVRSCKTEALHGENATVCDSLYSALGMEVHSHLAAQLGAQLDDAGFVVSDRHPETVSPAGSWPATWPGDSTRSAWPLAKRPLPHLPCTSA